MQGVAQLLIISPAVTWKNVPVGENIFAGMMIHMLEAEGIHMEFNVTYLDISCDFPLLHSSNVIVKTHMEQTCPRKMTTPSFMVMQNTKESEHS